MDKLSEYGLTSARPDSIPPLDSEPENNDLALVPEAKRVKHGHDRTGPMEIDGVRDGEGAEWQENRTNKAIEALLAEVLALMDNEIRDNDAIAIPREGWELLEHFLATRFISLRLRQMRKVIAACGGKVVPVLLGVFFAEAGQLLPLKELIRCHGERLMERVEEMDEVLDNFLKPQLPTPTNFNTYSGFRPAAHLNAGHLRRQLARSHTTHNRAGVPALRGPSPAAEREASTGLGE